MTHRLFIKNNLKSTSPNSLEGYYIKAASMERIKAKYALHPHYEIVDVTEQALAEYSDLEAFLLATPEEGAVYQKDNRWKLGDTIDFDAPPFPRAKKTYGDRVGAILSGNEKILKLIGFGIYDCDCPPAEAVGWMADGLREHQVPNPKIVLDSGSVVYGCECWWGTEGCISKMIEDLLSSGGSVEHIDIDEYRKTIREEKE